jgi:dihydrodipicolinate synthase/N-acetylneuraminate lyase
MHQLRDLTGIVASLHTPFTTDNRPDHESLVRLIDHVAAAGCSGVLATAVAGEVGSLRPDERDALLETVTAACQGRLQVIAGVSAPDLATSLDLAARARACDTDLVLWQPPATMADADLADALWRLGDAAAGPVMLQDLDWHGPGIPVATIEHCAASVPAFQALKVETAPAGPKYTAVRNALGSRLHLSGGWAAMHMLDGLARRLDAFIPSGLLPAYVRIFALWQQGDHTAARALFERCLPIITFSNQDIAISIAFWKQVRRLEGIFATERTRPPVGALDAVQAVEAGRLAERAVALDVDLTIQAGLPAE